MSAVDGDVIEMSVIHDNSLTGVQMNRFQYQLSTPTPVTDATLLDDVSVIIGQLYSLVANMIAIRNVLREIRVTNKTQDVLVGSTDASGYTGGSSAGSDLPQGTAAFVHLTTNVPRVILSKYIPSSTVGDTAAGGSLTSAALALLTSFGARLLTPEVSGTATYVYGYLSPKVAAFVVPQVATASAILAYQRRRKFGRGA